MLSKIIVFLLLSCVAIAYGRCNKPYITQTRQECWNSNGQLYSLWKGHINNPRDSEPLLGVQLSISHSVISELWDMVPFGDAGMYQLPYWRESEGIPANCNHTFGYITQSYSPAWITVSSYFCSNNHHEELSHPIPSEEECVCTLNYEPVCGEDGRTYENECKAKCAEVEVAYEGEC